MTLLMRRHGDSLDADAVNFIELSKNSTDRMGKQIDDLLAYSKVGRDLPTSAPVDVNTMIRTIEIELGEKIRDKKASIIIEQHMPIVRDVHSSMIHHIFQNLIANGIKFNNHTTPEVRIGCIESASTYTFSVRDNGIGIDAMYRDKVFQMFKRLHSDSEYEGTGIGLAVCKKIVDFYGGTIGIESERGKGTTIYFSLPKYSAGRTEVYQPEISSTDIPLFVSAA